MEHVTCGAFGGHWGKLVHLWQAGLKWRTRASRVIKSVQAIWQGQLAISLEWKARETSSSAPAPLVHFARPAPLSGKMTRGIIMAALSVALER